VVHLRSVVVLTEQLDSQSIYAEGGWASALVGQSWERFKFGGRPGSQQIALNQHPAAANG